ncbi:MAG: glycerol kinase GlpK [Dehalococcoidia bacterium]|nr:glycerol kinase GlpK [Dehalococcoidia bacterium]
MECVLAIDQGTTGSRAVLYGRHGAVQAASYREFAQRFPRPGWVEHDPIDVWDCVMGCVRDVLSVNRRLSVAAIGITNQRETAVAWDAETSEPLYNAIVWQCRRTSERCAELNANASLRDTILRVTGLPVDAYFSATKFEWLMHNVSAVEEAAARGTLRLGTIDSWLIWKLTASGVHATDHTNAARTMLFDIDRLQWSSHLLSFFGIPPESMPDARASTAAFGVTHGGVGMPSGIPISGVAGDQQAALFGQACFTPGSAKNTYGTGAFVLMNTGAHRPASDGRLLTTLGCSVGQSPVYVLEGSIFTAGAVIQWLRDGLHLIDSAEASQALAELVADNGGVYLVPALVGLGAPYWNSTARGMVTGITRGTTKEHLVRAALESMCYRTVDVVAAMVENCRVPLTQLRVDGGAARNDFICQFQADILGVPVVRPADVETTARGAAYLAGLGSGFWSSVKQIEGGLRIDRVFNPMMSSDERQRLYREWQSALGRALG